MGARRFHPHSVTHIQSRTENFVVQQLNSRDKKWRNQKKQSDPHLLLKPYCDPVRNNLQITLYGPSILQI